MLDRASLAHYGSTDSRLQALEVEIRDTIKRLARFEADYVAAEKAMLCGEIDPRDIPERLVQNLNQTVSRFRGLEIAWKNVGAIQGLESEYTALRRALAKARAKAVAVQSLLRQARTEPTAFHSNVDLQGLKALAKHSSEKLVFLARA